MSKLSKQQKQIAIVAAGAILLYLLYRHYAGSSQTSTSAGAQTPNTAASDYAALAGQQQSDAAALQAQNQQLQGQEQGDISTLTGQLAALAGQVAGITPYDPTALQGEISAVGAAVAALGTGTTPGTRTTPTTTKVAKGSAFAKYYKQVTGKNPPATVSLNNFVYEAYKAGIKASTIAQGHQAKHPSAKNTDVMHPNGNHQAKTGHHKQAAAGGSKATGGVKAAADNARAAVTSTAVKPPASHPAAHPTTHPDAMRPRKPTRHSGRRR